MKRILSILFVTVLLVAVLALASCAKKEPQPEQEPPHLEHEFVDVVVAPVCKKNGSATPGYTKHVCACGYEYVDTYVEPHKFTSTFVPATCHDLGYMKHTCDVCEYTKHDTYTDKKDATNHVYFYPNNYWNEALAGNPNVVEVVAPTCTNYGYSIYQCIYCDARAKFDIVDNVAAHTYGEWEVVCESSCFSNGLRERFCVDCGDIDQETMPMVDHKWEIYKFVMDDDDLNTVYEEMRCFACRTIKRNPIDLENVLDLELVEEADGKYYVVKGINPGKSSSTVVIPACVYLDGEKIPVKKISASAFVYNNDIEILYIPNSIVKIGASVFTGCTALKEIYYDEEEMSRE